MTDEIIQLVAMQEEEPVQEIQETKSIIMQRSLQDAGVYGSVKVDEASGCASAIDVIRLLDATISSTQPANN